MPIEQFNLRRSEERFLGVHEDYEKLEQAVKDACSNRNILKGPYLAEDGQTASWTTVFAIGSSMADAVAVVLIRDLEGVSALHELIAPQDVIDEVKERLE